MSKKVLTIIFSLVLAASMVSLSYGYPNDPNRVDPKSETDFSLRDYDRDKAKLPVDKDNPLDGGYNGGHDTITAEGGLLKKDVHEGNKDFEKWMDEQALPDIRAGVHDEDVVDPSLNTGWLNEKSKEVQEWWVGDPPISDLYKKLPAPDYNLHYYMPDGKGGGTGLDYLLKEHDSAVTRAEEYVKSITRILCWAGGPEGLSAEDKRVINYAYGRITHLLEDMAQPSHANNDVHLFDGIDKFYEPYVNDNWNKILELPGFPENINPVKYEEYKSSIADKLKAGINDPGVLIKELMNELAVKSKKYATEDDFKKMHERIEQLEVKEYNQGLTPEEEIELQKTKTDYENRMKENANDLIPAAILSTAVLMDSIYDNFVDVADGGSGGGSDGGSGGVGGLVCDSTTEDMTNPGGDHPDDSFEVSDEFYLQDEFGLSAYQLNNLYLRTGIKKGKIGLWYKKLFSDIYYISKGLRDDTPDEIKRGLVDEFEALKAKLKARAAAGANDFDGAQDVALLKNGFHKASSSLMLKFGEPVTIIDPNFDPGIVKDTPILLIPSAGLFGLENSAFFKASLDEYVKRGGTLVVFSQQRGYEFSVLPTPDGKPVTGYGWTEDQSCFTNAVYIDTYSQILSGQDRSTPTLNVDGYFTSYPEDSTVILRRTKNGQPAMISYSHGEGRVIATTMYSDWAFGHGQASTEEIALVRDLLSWAKAPAELPEAVPGQSVSLSLSVTNFSDVDATSVKLTVLDPNKNVITEQTVSGSITAGGTSTIPYTYATASDAPLGIWHVDYTLLDAQGNIIQPLAETDSGRFAVSSPPENPYESADFNLSVQSDSEYYAYGSTAIFTFNLWNNTDADRELKVTWGLPHHRFGWDNYFDKAVTVPANGTTKFTYVLDSVIDLDRLRARLYDEDGLQVGYAEKGIRMYYPSMGVSIETDKRVYGNGETVNMVLEVQNTQTKDYAVTASVKVRDALNTTVYSDTVDMSVSGSSTTPAGFSYTLPLNPKDDFYTITALVSGARRQKIGLDRTFFKVPKVSLSVSAELPGTFGSNNDISFLIENIGGVVASSAELKASLTAPDSTEVWSKSQTLTSSIQPGETMTVPLSMTVPNLAFGDYRLTYAVIHEDGQRSGEAVMANTVAIGASFDKPSSRVRETARLTVNVTNTGVFDLEGASVNVSVPDAGYEDTTSITLKAHSASNTLEYTIYIPETVTAGRHDVNVAVVLPSQSLVLQSVKLSIPQSALTIRHSEAATFVPGDEIDFIAANTGGVNTTASVLLKLTDSKGITVFTSSTSVPISATEEKTLRVPVSPDMVSERYRLSVELTDLNNALKTKNTRELQISGIETALVAKTDKDTYLTTEQVGVLSELTAGSLPITKATLNTKITTNRPGETWESLTALSTAEVPGLNGVRRVFVDSQNNKWFAGSGGFTLKFDGEQWETYDATSTDIPSGLSGLGAIDIDGSMWMITSKGLVRFDGTSWTTFTFEDYGFPKYPSISDIAIDKDGVKWITTTKMGVVKYDGYTWVNYNSSNSGLGRDNITSVVIDKAGNKWFGVDWYGVLVFDGSSWTKYDKNNTGGAIRGSRIKSLEVDKDGSVYVNTSWSIAKYDGTTWKRFFTGYAGGYANEVPAVLMADKENNLWIQNYTKILYKADTDGNVLESYTVDDRAGMEQIRSIAEDSEGGLWFTTEFGAGSLDGANWKRYTSDGLYSDGVYSVFLDKYGTNWFAHSKAISSFDGQDWDIYRYPSSRSVTIYSITGDNEGNKWMGTLGYGAAKLDANGNWTIFDTSNSGLVSNEVRRVFVDSKGRKWFATKSGVSVLDGITWQTYNTSNSAIPGDIANAIAEDKDGNIFVGVTGGVGKFDGTAWSRFSYYSANDIEFDREGNLWLGLSYGAIKYDGRRWDYGLMYSFYYQRDMEFDADGNLWVATYGKGLYKYDGSTVERVKDWGYFYALEIDADGVLWLGTGSYGLLLYRLGGSGGEEVVYNNDTPVDVSADDTLQITEKVDPLAQYGKYHLKSSLTNTYGQTIASSEYFFYVVAGDTVLLFNTDKELYKTGETVTISGEMRNLAGVSLDNAALTIASDDGTLLSDIVTVPATGSHTFSVETTAGSEGTVTLTGAVTQNSSTLVEIVDQYEVSTPVLSAVMAAPDVVGKDPFSLNVVLKNDGKVDAVVQFSLTGGVLSDTGELTLGAGEERLLQYTGQITGSVNYTLTITGDSEETLSKLVVYGEAAEVTLGAEATYPEGMVGVPVTITNTGTFDEELEISFELSSDSGVINEETRTYYLPEGSSVSDTLYYDVAKGNYTVSATSILPEASASVGFSVLVKEDVTMEAVTGETSEGLIPVAAEVVNAGYDGFSGSVVLTTDFWSGEAGVDLASGQSTEEVFNVNPAAAEPGTYELKVALHDTAGREISASMLDLVIQGPTLEITDIPPYTTFNAGTEGGLAFIIKNTGSQEGEASLNLKVMDVLDHTIVEWLKPGEEKTFDFAFLLPDDIEEKDYFADYSLNGTEDGQVRFHVTGVNISVDSALDRDNYAEGDTAVLTLEVTDNATDNGDAESTNLFARVNYNGYEETRPFTLVDVETLAFEVPLSEITGEKLFYGIYHESGRSIHLNTLYVYEAGEGITVTTDKQVYEPGDSVSISLSGEATGQMTLTGPGGYTETFDFTGTATRGFTLPQAMTAGTYLIGYTVTTPGGETLSGSHSIDVAGIQVKVTEATLDKARYASTDTIELALTIVSNEDLNAELKTWVVDPTGGYTSAGSTGVSLTSAENLLTTISASLSTETLGIHRLVYAIYSGELLLVSGAESFDVGSAVLLGVSTDKSEYPNGDETVEAASSLFGTVPGTLEFFIDGESVDTETVSLAGFETHTKPLSGIDPGAHTLKVVLTSGGLSSTKSTGFVYGSALPDLTIGYLGAERDGAVYLLEAAIVNSGKTISTATTVAIYYGDGDGLVTTLVVPALAPDESVTMNYDWNLLGLAGEHSIRVVVDYSNNVLEFNERNNTRSIDVTVPALILQVSTTAPEYGANEHVGVTTEMANMTSSTLYEGLTLSTVITGPEGNTLFDEADAAPPLTPASLDSRSFNWATASNYPGVYTVAARLVDAAASGAEEILVAGTTTFTILPTPSVSGEFSLSKETVIRGFDLTVSYTLTNDGNVDLGIGEVSAELIPIGSDTPVTTYTGELDSIAILEETTGSVIADALDVEPGDYLVRLVVLVEGVSFAIGELPLKVLPPLQVTKTLSLEPRALVLLDKVNDKVNSKKSRNSVEEDLTEAVVAEALVSLGAHYKVVRDVKVFAAEMRSGLYNLYVLSGTEPLGGYLDSELVERVNSGEGLILVDYETMEYQNLRNATGLKSFGSLPKGTRTVMTLESPVTGEGGTLGAYGKVQRLGLVSDEAMVAAVIYERGRYHPAVVLNPYGRGRIVTIGFDLAASAKALGSTVPYSELLGGLVRYGAPIEAVPGPGQVVGVEVTLKSFGASFELKVTEELSTTGVLLTSPAGKVDADGITWELTLGADEDASLLYLTTVPEEGGTYVNTTTVEYARDGSYETYNTYPVTITTENVIDLEMRILASLESLSDAEEITQRYTNLLSRPLVLRRDIERSIHELLKVIDALASLDDDTDAIRLDLDNLLKTLQAKWVGSPQR